MKLITERGFLCCVWLAAVAASMALHGRAGGDVTAGSKPPTESLRRGAREGIQAGWERYQYTQLHMGVQVRVTLYAPDQPTAERAGTAVFARFAQLDDMMSDYRASSELMRLCARAGGPPLSVSKELFYVLERAQEISRRSDGDFDVTVGPVVKLWRVARKSGKLPEESALKTALSVVGWQKVKLDKHKSTVRLLQPGMQLDLGGIAKGYANDEAMKLLKQQGIRSAMLEAGGDILMSDAPPGKEGWNILVANPAPGDKEKRLVVSNCAVSTSGDTEQFVIIDGKRYSHVVDPHTGLGLSTRIMATVIAPTGVLADPLSKAAAMLDGEKLAKLVAQYKGVETYVRRVE